MKLPVRLVFVLALSGLALSVSLAAGTQDIRQAIVKPMREPIRVGGNVQQSKLISKVDPVYPEEARNARVSGAVILQATINELGEVVEIQILRGHPLLDYAAVNAVKEWRYSPTYLNGEAVPVIATVSVIFNLGVSTGPSLVMEMSGNLRDPSSQLEGAALIEKLKELKGDIAITPDPGVPSLTIEATLKALQKEGVKNISLRGAYLFREGRLFYTAPSPLVQSPELALDNDRLTSIAKASGHVEEIPRAGDGRRMLLYRLFINEVSEIMSIEQLRGPKLPEVEAELARTRVIMPGRRGIDTVPTAVAVEVAVDK